MFQRQSARKRSKWTVQAHSLSQLAVAGPVWDTFVSCVLWTGAWWWAHLFARSACLCAPDCSQGTAAGLATSCQNHAHSSHPGNPSSGQLYQLCALCLFKGSSCHAVWHGCLSFDWAPCRFQSFLQKSWLPTWALWTWHCFASWFCWVMMTYYLVELLSLRIGPRNLLARLARQLLPMKHRATSIAHRYVKLAIRHLTCQSILRRCGC